MGPGSLCPASCHHKLGSAANRLYLPLGSWASVPPLLAPGAAPAPLKQGISSDLAHSSCSKQERVGGGAAGFIFKSCRGPRDGSAALFCLLPHPLHTTLQSLGADLSVSWQLRAESPHPGGLAPAAACG